MLNSWCKSFVLYTIILFKQLRESIKYHYNEKIYIKTIIYRLHVLCIAWRMLIPSLHIFKNPCEFVYLIWITIVVDVLEWERIRDMRSEYIYVHKYFVVFSLYVYISLSRQAAKTKDKEIEENKILCNWIAVVVCSTSWHVIIEEGIFYATKISLNCLERN